MSLYENESREADVKLTEPGKQKPGEKVAYSRGDTVNSPLPESCVLFVGIYSAQSLPIGPSQDLTRPQGLTRRDTHNSL
jgi:hypothetical protein